MDPTTLTGLTEFVLAAGALGTAAFGIVEAFKWTPLGLAGFGQITKTLGRLMETLEEAYGADYLHLLKSQYRTGRAKGDLRRTIRQGVRVGLNADNAARMAAFVGVTDKESLKAGTAILKSGDELKNEVRNAIGRFELAVDTRIDAALSLAQSDYVGTMRIAASTVAIVLALVAAYYLDADKFDIQWVKAFIVGIVAVPLAPIAKDVATALRSAGKAVKAVK